MAVADRPRPRIPVPLLRVPPVRDYGAPGWFERLPHGVGTAGVLVFLLVVSGFIRGHYLNGELWSAEAGTVGIASHGLSAIPGLLWQGGGAPLYFWLLHLWMSLFGSTEIAVHALSLLFGLLTVPLAMWLGFGLWGRRGGYLAAGLFAFNAFLTQYAEEGRPYELLCLLGLLATGAFLHAFQHRRRGWLPVFGVALVGLAYTDDAGFLLWLGAAVALVPVLVTSEDRGGVLRDAALAFAGAFVLYVPWLPTLIHQIGSATAPWHYAPLPGLNFPRKLLGSDRVDAAMALAVVAGLWPVLERSRRRERDSVTAGALVLIVVAAVIAGLIASVFMPSWVARYYAPIVPALLLLVALGSVRSGIVGLAVVVVTCAFLANPASFIPKYKSDMSDIGAEVGAHLHRGDVVLVTQPDQAPLVAYYLPAGLRFFTAVGPDTHPSYTDWDGALGRLRSSHPTALVNRVVGSLSPGQQVLLVRPLTEGRLNWSQSWTELVRRRSAQIGAALVSSGGMRAAGTVFLPHNYRGSCCTALSALLYVKR